MPFEHLALDLQADQQKEQGHQAVVDPQQQWLGDLQGADLHGHWHVQQAVVEKTQGRVIDGHGQYGGADQQQATGRFQLQKAGKSIAHKRKGGYPIVSKTLTLPRKAL